MAIERRSFHGPLNQVKIFLFNLPEAAHQVEAPAFFVLDEVELIQQWFDGRVVGFQEMHLSSVWLEIRLSIGLEGFLIHHPAKGRKFLERLSSFHLVF